MHTLLVTSAVAGEGKTTVACNLALGLEKERLFGTSARCGLKKTGCLPDDSAGFWYGRGV